jgi:hypothetical protein
MIELFGHQLPTEPDDPGSWRIGQVVFVARVPYLYMGEGPDGSLELTLITDASVEALRKLAEAGKL